MPGARPESSGPVCAVTAWRASTSLVAGGALGCSSVALPSCRSGAASSAEGVATVSVTPLIVPGRLGRAAGERSEHERRGRYILPVTDQPISFSPQGLPETVLDPEPADALDALARALAAPDPERRDAVSAGVAQWPRF